MAPASFRTAGIGVILGELPTSPPTREFRLTSLSHALQRALPLLIALAAGAARPLASQALATPSSAGCAGIMSLSSGELLERERLATFDRRQRESMPGFWRELGCIRQALDRAGHRGREGALMIAGTSWHQGAINAYLQGLRSAPTDSLTLDALGASVLDDWYADSLGAVGRALLAGANGGVRDATSLRACTVAAFWARDHATAAGCAMHGLRQGWDSTVHALALARVAAGREDTTATSTWLNLAVAAARGVATREALKWHLQWFLSPAEQEVLDSVTGDTFVHGVRDALARRDVRDGRAPGARVVEHFHRLEYAEQHFPMLRPRAERERLRSLPATIIFPDTLIDRLRQDRLRYGLDGDLYSFNTRRPPHEVPALPFREYARWQVDLDDRGIVYLRYGAPAQRIPRIGLYFAREVWLYWIDGEKLLVHFEAEAFSGSLEATRLVTAVLGDYLCDVDVRRCLLLQKPGRVDPEEVAALKAQDREFMATATTKDDNSVRAEKTVRLLASAYSLWQPQTGARVTVFPYAIRLRDLGKQAGDSLLVPVALQARSWDGAAGVGRDTTVVRRLRAPRNAGGDDYVTGAITLPGSAGLSAWSLVVSQGEERAGRYYDEQHAPLGTGPLVLSDVVLGAVSQKLSWPDGRAGIPLAPLQGFNQKEPVALYVQVQSSVARADGVAFEVVIARPAAPGKERKVDLTVGFKRALTAGLNELQQELDISRLDSGEYQLEITVRHAATGASDRRSARLVVR